MESSLVSWQYENFSSAKLVSPPVSPAPPSPTFYSYGVPSSSTPTGKDIKMERISISNPTRAQMASYLLKNLEEFDSNNSEMNDFGMNWDEESVNLGLFEELSEIEYTPPASPKKTLNPQHQLTNFSCVEQLPTDSLAVSALTAEFQAILESLPKDNIMDIGGIPTTIIDGEALVPIEIDLSLISEQDLKDLNIEIDNVNVQIIDEDDMEIINESEILDLGHISNDGSSGSPASSSGYNDVILEEDEDDRTAHTAERILDALLLGDVYTAQSYVTIDDDSSMSSNYSGSQSSYVEEVPVRKISASNKKPERRGRKPGKRLAKGSLEYIKNKSLRKKEQNKTAATRYRQKKKLEVVVTLETESELQEKHDELEKTKDDLHRQIIMVKQLLREIINAKKPKPSLPVIGKSSPVVSGGGLTVSRVVGRNRRK